MRKIKIEKKSLYLAAFILAVFAVTSALIGLHGNILDIALSSAISLAGAISILFGENLE